MVWITLTLELDLLGSNPSTASCQLCGFKQSYSPSLNFKFLFWRGIYNTYLIGLLLEVIELTMHVKS